MRVLLPILGYRFFPSITLNILWHSLLAWRVSVDKSADILMGVLLYVICHFSLFAFTILSLPLTLVSLITICLSVFLLGFILSETLCFLDLVDSFLSHVSFSFHFPGEGNCNPLQYSCLENPMDRRAWWVTVHGLPRVGHDWVTSLSLSFPMLGKF